MEQIVDRHSRQPAPGRGQTRVDASDYPVRSDESRIVAAIVGGLYLAGVAWVVWLWYPLARWEFRRHEPWTLLLLHCGEAGTVFLCLQWVVAGVWRRAPTGFGVARRGVLHVGRAFLVLASSSAIEAATTQHFLRAAGDAYERAVPVTGTAECGYRWHLRDYMVFCSYPDNAGRVHDARLNTATLGGSLHIDLHTTYPTPILLRYDPAWPDRCWVSGGGTGEDDVLLWWSQWPLMIALAAIMMLLMLSPLLPASGASLYGLARLLPLTIQIAFWGWLAWAHPELRLS